MSMLTTVLVLLVAVEHIALAAFLVVEEKGQGDAGFTRPVRVGRIVAVTDQVAWVLSAHCSLPFRSVGRSAAAREVVRDRGWGDCIQTALRFVNQNFAHGTARQPSKKSAQMVRSIGLDAISGELLQNFRWSRWATW